MKIKTIITLALIMMSTGCGGGGEDTAQDREVNLKINWQEQTLPEGFSNYLASLSVKGILVAEDGKPSLDVSGVLAGGVYLFNFPAVSEGNYTLNFDLYYASSGGSYEKVASGSVAFAVRSEEIIDITFDATGLAIQSDTNQSIQQLLPSISPLNIDSDQDGLTDKEETLLGTDFLNPDTDADSLPDGVEVSGGTDPLKADTDGDGADDKKDAYPLDTTESADTDKDDVGDNKDNCVNAANKEQTDSDSNGIGDACSDDDDGDSLSDSEELKIGTSKTNPDSDKDGLPDGLEISGGTNPLKADTDGDNANDKDDAFPLNSGEWADADKDGVGDNGDNCKNISNTGQKNIDLEYFDAGIKTPAGGDVEADTLGDACDSDIDGDGLHITYVYGEGDDANIGTFASPVKSLQVAINLAKARGDDIYAAVGTYDLKSVIFADGVDIYGGYSANFAEKNFQTILTRSDSPVTLFIKDFSGTFTLNGFSITNSGQDDGVGDVLPDSDDYGCSQATVYIVNSHVTLSNNIISTSGASLKPCGVLLDTDAEVTLAANRIEADSLENASSSTGVVVFEALATLANNIIMAGTGKHSVGVRMTDVATVLVNNTIDASSGALNPKSSSGIIFDGGSPKLINNLIFTSGGPDQYVLRCSGSDPIDAEFKNNLLTTFPQEGTNTILADCEGNFNLVTDFVTSPVFTLKGAVVSGNIAYSGALGGLVDASYNLAGSVGVDAGLDTASFGFSADYNGKARPQGAGYDIGAIEK